ncbi:hypothetical protein DSL72_001707 [Monilinia vaccinii-corymbosi]|uniref:GH64 domain-containing protein n=1 Tax=Monilinia vaccinii-corymbosi TaxID=61207 RepID=A0A8A3P9I8_9HELO|nr:hypothetical protein DSL72_001707 [Monilinia vaccinii-corymbosi]
MATISDVIRKQKEENILYSPEVKDTETAGAGALTIGLVNESSSNTVYAYVTGLSVSNNYAVVLLQADGSTLYYPENPSSDDAALIKDCAIPLGAPGSTTKVTIPYISGGRIWFCVGSTLSFLLNSGTTGPSLIEPSVSNTADPNYLKSWDFCEFTYDSSQLFANITYVDFVCLPIALTLNGPNGLVEHIGGLPADGLSTVCSNLIAQNGVDGAGWDQLVVTNGDANLRALHPTQGIAFNPALFKNYWDSYVDAVWDTYVGTTLTVNTQASWGNVPGLTSNDSTSMLFGSMGSFTKPSAADIFSGTSGAFAPKTANTSQLLNIGARLDAAFNRSTLLINPIQPDNESVSTYYNHAITNHYARIVHAANVDGLGYCFPYDDVTPAGGTNQCGAVQNSTPTSFTVTVGGNNAHSQSNLPRAEVSKLPDAISAEPLHWNQPTPEENSEQPSYLDSDSDIEFEKRPKRAKKTAYSKQSKFSFMRLPPILDYLFGGCFAATRWKSPSRRRKFSPAS